MLENFRGGFLTHTVQSQQFPTWSNRGQNGRSTSTKCVCLKFCGISTDAGGLQQGAVYSAVEQH